MEDGVGGAAGCGDGGDGVLEGFPVQDVAGRDPVADEVHNEATCFATGGGFVGRHGGDAGDVHRGDAEELAGHGHGVGGELTAAGAGAGAGGGFERFELGVVDLAGGVGAHAFEDLEDGDFFGGAVGLLEGSGGDGAAVEHEAGDVEAGEGHDGGGHVFVTAGDTDEAVEGVAAGDELDRVCDDFAGDERGFHALGAHGDAVVDGDGVELHGGAAGLAHALLDGFGDVA